MARRFKVAEFPWWFWILSIDVLLIGATVLRTHLPRHPPEGIDFAGYDKLHLLTSHLNLTAEMNLAVWWSGGIFFLTALITYELFSTENSKTRFAWLVLSVVFLVFSLDEISSIHERALVGWMTIPGVAVLLAGVSLIIPVFWHLLRKGKTRRSGILLLVGLAIIGSAVPHEYLEHHIDWPSSLLGMRAGMEEGSEILGALICLYALVKQRRKPTWPNQLSKAVPNPFRMLRMPALLYTAFLLHVATAVITVTALQIDSRGDPAVYFPSAVFIILFAACFWKIVSGEESRKTWWFLQTMVFGVASVATFYLLTPHAFRLISAAAKLDILWSLYLGTACLLFALARHRALRREGAFFLATIAALAAGYVLDEQMAYYIVAGGVAVLMSGTVLHRPAFERNRSKATADRQKGAASH